MENNHNFLGKNLKRLPPGLRFHPTDEELLFEYLRCKVFDLSLPASVIPQIGFLNFDPWDLPGNSPRGRRTDWCMHEYSLDFNSSEVPIQVEDWAIYSVCRKQRNEEVGDSTSLHEDQSTYYSASPTSSSNSIYKVSSHETNYHERNSYSPYRV
ncbi:hypothetical protein KSS87_016902 [Heliosperma pusillum]|nr:hypothetical protein KSS87_016902 [Heliosperma pusillum]